jgi:hypothetical protein
MIKSYISYFQKVITIGVITSGESVEEATHLAELNVKDADTVPHCCYNETKFELGSTEEWNPEIDSEVSKNGLTLTFNPSLRVKNIVAARAGKNIADLTNDDCLCFVKEAIENSLGGR